MATRVLSIVETAYRATIEEQDDTVLWLTHMLKTSGLDMTVLLRANAVNYLVDGQDASGLHIGDVPLDHTPRLDDDLERLLEHGVPIYYVAEDVAVRGIDKARIIEGTKAVAQHDLPELLDTFQQVWHW
jgi:predicted peroxiredoxin